MDEIGKYNNDVKSSEIGEKLVKFRKFFLLLFESMKI